MNLFKIKKLQQGFTLIELLVVIGILAVLLAITLIAINPARQFAQANNTQRSSDVNAILNAVGQYLVDNKGDLSAMTALNLTATPTDIVDVTTDPAGVDICALLVPDYIAAMPVDPQNGSWTDCVTYDTQYEISVSATNNRVTVAATAESVGGSTPVISVTR